MDKRDRPEKKDESLGKGKGCRCGAYGECECGCDVDWNNYSLYNQAIQEYEEYLKNKIKEMPVEYRELVNKYFGGYYE